MTKLGLIALVTCLIAVAFVACNGDGGGESGKQTPPPTEVATPVGIDEVKAHRPEINPQLDVLGDGALKLMVPAGKSVFIQTLERAVKAGINGRDCVFLFFVFTWQVTDPDPPDGVDLEFYNNLPRGDHVFLRRGPSGEAAVSCAPIEVVNKGTTDVKLDFLYVLAFFYAPSPTAQSGSN